MIMNVFSQEEIASSYDEWYTTDFGKKADEIEKETIDALLNKVPRSTMLELGCGTGHWSRFFVEKGFEVTATDISEPMLEQAKNKNIEAAFLLADAEALPFEKETFNTVATITMLEFIENRENVFKEIYRVLKPGGWLLTGCLNKNSVMGKNKDQDGVFKHGQFFTQKELEKELELFGKPEIKPGLFLTPNFNIVDATNEMATTEPVFFAAAVQKLI